MYSSPDVYFLVHPNMANSSYWQQGSDGFLTLVVYESGGDVLASTSFRQQSGEQRACAWKSWQLTDAGVIHLTMTPVVTPKNFGSKSWSGLVNTAVKLNFECEDKPSSVSLWHLQVDPTNYAAQTTILVMQHLMQIFPRHLWQLTLCNEEYFVVEIPTGNSVV